MKHVDWNICFQFFFLGSVILNQQKLYRVNNLAPSYQPTLFKMYRKIRVRFCLILIKHNFRHLFLPDYTLSAGTSSDKIPGGKRFVQGFEAYTHYTQVLFISNDCLSTAYSFHKCGRLLLFPRYARLNFIQ